MHNKKNNDTVIKTKIYKTKDYGKFNFIPENRIVDEKGGHVKVVKKALESQNLMVDFPVVVDEKMNVIDGQNRLEAAKQAGLDVYYRIAIKAKPKDISMLNTVLKKWRPEDQLHKYVMQGNHNYIKFNNLMKEFNIPSVGMAKKFVAKIKPSSTFYTDRTKNAYENVGSVRSDHFNFGLLEYPKDESAIREEVRQFTRLNKYCGKSFNRSAVVAYDTIKRTKGYNHNRMIKKLIKHGNVGPVGDQDHLREMLQKIYNNGTKTENKLFFETRVK